MEKETTSTVTKKVTTVKNSAPDTIKQSTLKAKKASNNAIVPYLYTSHSVKELLDEYIQALRKTGNVEDMIHANKLLEIESVLFDNTFLSMIKKHYEALYSLTKKKYPKLKFFLEGRRKSVIGCEKKINLFISQGRSLEEFRDVLAFRFILFDNDISFCYKLMETVIDFNIKHEFQPCIATSPFQTEGFEKENFPGIQVPEKAMLSDEYRPFVKDYVLEPKETGYQSLHATFQDPKTGRYFEVQIRNFDMHIHAESDDNAGHDAYKKARYSKNDIQFDRSRILIDGYRYVGDQIFDYIGLEKSYEIIQRGRTL